MSTVKIKNVQAVRFVEFSMPAGEGGVRLFKGENGAGKSTCLRCLNALLGKKEDLSPSDDAPKGEISGLGVTKTIGKTTRGMGDIDVPILEGIDIGDLVEPQAKSADVRNKTRIRALVGLTAKGCEESDFYELFGGQEAFEQVIVDEDGDLDAMFDVLEMADWIKKQTEKRARLEEARSESAMANWQAAVEQSKGHDPAKQPASVDELATAYSEARNRHADAVQKVELSQQAAARNEQVDAALEKHMAAKPTSEMADCSERLKGLRKTAADLEAKLALVRQSVAQVEQQFNAAAAWEERKIEIEAMRQDVGTELVDPEPLAKAAEEALAALKNAEEIRQRNEAAVKAKTLAVQAKEHKIEADRLRELAKRTGEVVTAKLPAGPLQVKDGLLCAYHEKRDRWVPYDELSTGERWEIAIDVAVSVLGEGGVIPLSQESWQGLDEPSRKHVSKLCRARKVWLVSAEVGEGDLHVVEA